MSSEYRKKREYLSEYGPFTIGCIIRSYLVGYWRVTGIYRDMFGMVKLEHTQVANALAYPPQNRKRCCSQNLCKLVTKETLQEEQDELAAQIDRIETLKELL